MPDFSDILLTVDFDRTLTAPDSSIPERNLEAIRYFMDNGGAFTVNTGRSLAMFRRYFDQIPVNAPLLLYNGSAAYDLQKQDFAFCHLIDLDLSQTVREIRQLLPDLEVEVQGLEHHILFHDSQIWDDYNDYNGCPRRHANLGDDVGPFIKICVFGPLYETNVSHLFHATPAEMARFDEAEQLLREKYGAHMEVFRSGARILDLHAKGVSKGRSARELLQQLGRSILVCVGDGENDLHMLDAADFAFCPADAVIAHRYQTVCPCGDGAVADVIFKEIPKILQTGA